MTGKRAYPFPFGKYPAVRIALLMIAGILIGEATSIGFYYWLAAAGLIFCLPLAAAFIRHHQLGTGLHYLVVISYLTGLIAFGAAWQTGFDADKKPPSARLLDTYTWQSVQCKGTIVQMTHTTTGKLRLDVAVDTTLLADSLEWVEPYILRVYGKDTTQSFSKAIKLGTRIHFRATIYPLEKRSNPHEFAYKQYLVSHGIYLQAGLEQIYTVWPSTNFWSWLTLQRATLKLIEHNFGPQTAALAKGLLIGYKNELTPKVKQAFSRAGLSHIMAVSGMNVVFILAPFWFVIPFFWTLRYGKQLAFALMGFILVFHAGLTGFSASVMRATIVGGFITYGRIFHKATDAKNLTAVAAIIILLIQPNDLFDIGFQLSFAAVYIILLILPVINQILPDKIQHRWYGIPVMAVILSLIVQWGLYPILSYYFGEFSLVAPLANALVIPFLTLLVPYALFLLPVATIFPHFSYLMNTPCRWFIECLQWFTLHAAGWQWSWITTPSTSMFLFLIWLAVFIWVAALPVVRLRWKAFCLLLGVICVQQGYMLYRQQQTPLLKVVMLDVGQGDATFITTPAGKHLLIDTGRWSPGYNSGDDIILPYLKATGVQNLDAVFLSHPHADHIGGVAALIGEIPIGTIYTTGLAYTSNLYKNYLSQARAHQIPVKTLHAGNAVNLDPSIKILAYGPTAGNTFATPNNHSLVLELIYGHTQFLFMGDAESQQEKRLARHYPSLLNTDFLKVGHHGSNTSSSQSFLKIVTPSWAGVSLGKRNRYDHPDVQAIRRLRNTGARLYFTSLDGALVFVSDGTEISYQPWR